MKHSRMRTFIIVMLAVAIAGCAQIMRMSPMHGEQEIKKAKASGKLSGFEESTNWDEQYKWIKFEPGVRIYINAPSEEVLDPDKPTQIIFYALPNGNSIEWTIGREKSEDLDWHYFIQHIGAQTRRLREVIEEYNIIVVYLEAEGKSWPKWRGDHPDNPTLIANLVDAVRNQIPLSNTSVVLSSHSGGGSFMFGYLNAFEKIPDDVVRISFLDSNYGFSVEDRHGEKLLEWLQRNPKHFLSVLAYDDREITYNGKKVLGPMGGTYRATNRMLDWLRPLIEIEETNVGDTVRYQGLGKQLDAVVHKNPENRILHTVLVGDMNGFIYSMTVGEKYEGKAAVFGGPIAYEQWIQTF